MHENYVSEINSTEKKLNSAKFTLVYLDLENQHFHSQLRKSVILIRNWFELLI